MEIVIGAIVAILAAFGYVKNKQVQELKKKQELENMEKDINPLRQAIEEHKRRVESDEDAYRRAKNKFDSNSRGGTNA